MSLNRKDWTEARIVFAIKYDPTDTKLSTIEDYIRYYGSLDDMGDKVEVVRAKSEHGW